MNLSASARQFGTDFNYQDLDAMRDDDWMITNPAGVSPGKNGVTLDAAAATTALYMPANVKTPVLDWRVGVKGVWPGGGKAYLNVTVITMKRSYACVADGAAGKWRMERNGEKVAEIAGYKPSAGAVVEMYLEKTGETITIHAGGKKATYRETDPSEVAQVGVVAPKGTTARYVWAGAFIPEVSLEGGTDEGAAGDPTEGSSGETEASPDPGDNPPTDDGAPDAGWNTYEPASEDQLDAILSLLLQDAAESGAGTGSGAGQDNTGAGQDGTDVEQGDSGAGQDGSGVSGTTETESGGSGAAGESGTATSSPAPSPTAPAPPGPGNWVVIVIQPSTFTLNTDVSEYDAGAEAEACHYTVNGVSLIPYVGVWCDSDKPALAQEQKLHTSGLVSPETRIDTFHPYCDSQPSYFVKIDTHVSGQFDTLAHAQAAVAIVTAQVTDAQGNVIYSNRITEVSSNGHTLDDMHVQAAQGLNAFLEGVIRPPSTKP